MASVLHLFRAPQRRLPMEELLEIRAFEDSGLEGCGHARSGSPRQVLLVDSETLELMDLQPGSIRENITTRGINVNGLPVGQNFALARRSWKSAWRVRPAIYWKRSGRDCGENCAVAAGCCVA